MRIPVLPMTIKQLYSEQIIQLPEGPSFHLQNKGSHIYFTGHDRGEAFSSEPGTLSVQCVGETGSAVDGAIVVIRQGAQRADYVEFPPSDPFLPPRYTLLCSSNTPYEASFTDPLMVSLIHSWPH